MHLHVNCACTMGRSQPWTFLLPQNGDCFWQFGSHERPPRFWPDHCVLAHCPKAQCCARTCTLLTSTQLKFREGPDDLEIAHLCRAISRLVCNLEIPIMCSEISRIVQIPRLCGTHKFHSHWIMYVTMQPYRECQQMQTFLPHSSVYHQIRSP